jgi:hypothetical protein
LWRFLVEHLVQWFSSANVIELQPAVISLDIQNPVIEMKFKQVKIVFFVLQVLYLFIQIRLILEFLQETTKYWMRYSERFFFLFKYFI